MAQEFQLFRIHHIHFKGTTILNQKSTYCSVAIPPSYTNVPPASIKSKELKVPMVDGFAMPTSLQQQKKQKLNGFKH